MNERRAPGALGLLLSLFAAGCASTAQEPIRTSNTGPLNQQQPTASYWNTLADAVVDNTERSLAELGCGHARPLYVGLPSPATPFSETYRDLLITRFVERGFAVSEEPQGTVLVDFDTQVLRDQELVTSTYLKDESGMYLMRHTDIYFIDPDQAPLYQASAVQIKYMEVVDR